MAINNETNKRIQRYLDNIKSSASLNEMPQANPIPDIDEEEKKTEIKEIGRAHV